MREYSVCKSADLPDGSMKAFSVDSTEMLIGRLSGRLFACDNSCPHRGASLSKGELRGNRVICYMHKYEFDVFTGRLENMKSWKKDDAWVEQSPEWRKSGDLVLYGVREQDGDVYVSLP